MKKLLIGLSLLASVSTFADISKNCSLQMDELILDHQEFEAVAPSMVSKGELTHDEVESLRRSHDKVVEMAALTCSIMRKVQLQRSFLGRFGLISQERAENEGQLAHDQAILYYENNK